MDNKEIKIKKEVVESIIKQAKEELPNEACGYLLGIGNSIMEAYKMINMDNSPEHFSFDPQEQFGAVRYAREQQLEIVANWHSHPATPSRPSEEDIKLAYDPHIFYFILSLATPVPVLNAFRIREREFLKLKLIIE